MKSTFAEIPMVKQLITLIFLVVFFSSCTALKQMNFTSNRQVAAVADPAPAAPAKAKFIEDISITPRNAVSKEEVTGTEEPEKNKRPVQIQERPVIKEQASVPLNLFAGRTPSVETASPVQFKYSLLLNTEVESLPSNTLLNAVDEWYGVRYRVGGNTKSGVDCSGFTVAVYTAAYGLMLPRVSRDQYRMSRKISTTELQEGDLVFFNTKGRGVSHVGVYLGNNKFIHASVSRGVMVSDLFESYYLKRFAGAGRIDEKQVVASK